MDQLTRDPASGAMWREIQCFFHLGIKSHATLALGIALLLPSSWFMPVDLFCTAVLLWTSITQWELHQMEVHTTSNAALRLSTSYILYYLLNCTIGYWRVATLKVLEYVDNDESDEYENVREKLKPEDLLETWRVFQFGTNCMIFGLVRLFWNGALLGVTAFESWKNFEINIKVDRTSTYARAFRSKLKSVWQIFEDLLVSFGNMFLCYRGDPATLGFLRNAISLTSQPMLQELDSLIIFGLSYCTCTFCGIGSLSFICGYAWAHQWPFQVAIVLAWISSFHYFQTTEVKYTSCMSQWARLIVDILGFLALTLLSLVIPVIAWIGREVFGFVVFVLLAERRNGQADEPRRMELFHRLIVLFIYTRMLYNVMFLWPYLELNKSLPSLWDRIWNVFRTVREEVQGRIQTCYQNATQETKIKEELKRGFHGRRGRHYALPRDRSRERFIRVNWNGDKVGDATQDKGDSGFQEY